MPQHREAGLSLRPRFGIALAFSVASLLVPVRSAVAAAEPIEPTHFAEGPSVVRIYYGDVGRIAELVDFDLLEFRARRQGFVLALVDAQEATAIVARGFAIEIDEARTAELRLPRPPATAAIPGFACYRTVEETYATAQALVVDRPDLASWIDIGDTWEKTAGIGGYDLGILKLTNSAISGPKPKLIVSSSIHAREYAPAEISTRFGEFLVKNYDSDPDARWILDHHEVHLLLQGNPDGRKQAETGLSWRKNTNRGYCGATSVNRGADLNRNFSFGWGCCGGSSGSACSLTFRGPAAGSEPETQALQTYLRSEFPDQRDAPLTSPAPADATGLYIDTHSSGELVLWPWGFPGTAPNESALRTLGRKLAYFNGHEPQQAAELYPTDGTTIDFVYGELGVASIVFEVGTAFFQNCSTFESTVYPENFDALLFAAKIARTPYLTPAGPEMTAVAVDPPVAVAGGSRLVTATADDTRFNSSNGVEAFQTVVAAELYVDTPPWNPGAIAISLDALDGAFDEPVEASSMSVPTTGLAPGHHMIFVRAQDASGNWGPIGAAFLEIEAGPEGTLAGTVTDALTAAPLAAEITAAGEAVMTDPSTGAYSITIPSGSWTAVASAPGYLTAEGRVEINEDATTTRAFFLTPSPRTLLVDDDDDSPDVRGPWVTALDAIDEPWAVWDTESGTHEPDASDLSSFRNVIWFSGDDVGGQAGPSPIAETGLATWLDSGRCLLLASQDYYRDRGLTSFLNGRFGIGGVTGDVAQTIAVGHGAAFGGLGPYALSFPYPNATDLLSVAATGAFAFSGEGGPLASSRDTSYWRTTFWTFGLETLPTPAARATVLDAWRTWCRELPTLDADDDGISNADDCAPLDPATWASPSVARDLRLARGSGTLNWAAPAAPGAFSVDYDVLRGSGPDLADASCVAGALLTPTAVDPLEPPINTLWTYAIRVRNACGANLGANSDGVPRAAPACP